MLNQTVTATNKNTGMARSSVSNDEGYYAILLLPPGIYNVAAEASGFVMPTAVGAASASYAQNAAIEVCERDTNGAFL